MSQEFKKKMFETEGENLTGEAQTTPPEAYPAGSNTRNLAFVWVDGKKKFFNYAYLVSCDYSPNDRTITLEFTTHIIALKGMRLELLFNELMDHLPRIIKAADQRYNQLAEKDKPVVNEIIITEK